MLGPPCVHHDVCMDNLGVFGPDPQAVEGIMADVEHFFNERELLLHKTEAGSSAVDLLGVEVGGISLCTMIQRARYWRLRRGFEALLRLWSAARPTLVWWRGLHCLSSDRSTCL